MSDSKNSPSFFARVRECFAALKEIAMVVIIVLMFLNPQLIGRTLYQAGITSLFGIGLDLEKFAAATAEARTASKAVETVTDQIQKVSQELERIVASPRPTIGQIKELSASVKDLDAKAGGAQRTLERSIAVQKELFERLPIQMQRRIDFAPRREE